MAIFRIGTVVNVFTDGKVTAKVRYDDTDSTSRELQVLGCADIPEVGDTVVTMHMETGSAKGFIIGRYYTTRADIPHQTKKDMVAWEKAQDDRLDALESRVAALEATAHTH